MRPSSGHGDDDDDDDVPECAICGEEINNISHAWKHMIDEHGGEIMDEDSYNYF